MPKARQPRVEIEPTVYKALCAKGLIQDRSPKDLVNQWIIVNLSPKAREFLETGAHGRHSM